MTLAQRYGVPYEEIMFWFCQHYGFGEIDLAYSLSRASGKTVEEVFAIRASGMGWGEIKKQLNPDKDKNDNKKEDQEDMQDEGEKNEGGGNPDKKDNKPPKKTPKPKKKP